MDDPLPDNACGEDDEGVLDCGSDADAIWDANAVLSEVLLDVGT